jgi:signal peptidase I
MALGPQTEAEEPGMRPVTLEHEATSSEQPGEPPAAGAEASPTEPGRRGKRRGIGAAFRELPVLLLVAFLVALLIKTFLIQAFYIPSSSMENTLKVGDRVLVNKLVYHLHPPRRMDIIVFADPHPAEINHRSAVSGAWHWLTEGLGVSSSSNKDFIKRVIGLPGDRVEMDHGVVSVNGTPLREPYLNPIQDLRDYGPITVPAGNLFVMGDNRTNSLDSRFALGMIPYDKVIGRAFVVIWPPSRVGWLRRS